MISYILMAIDVAVPLVAVAMERFGDVGISEWHHSHHDTYMAPAALSRALVLGMVLMGAVGLLLSWLCHMDVFHVDPSVVLSFFVAFLVSMLFMWACMRRYRVTTYDDHMVVRPFVGPTRSVCYKDIQLIRWLGPMDMPELHMVRVYWESHRLTLVGLFDLEQILSRINRFDVMEGTGLSS